MSTANGAMPDDATVTLSPSRVITCVVADDGTDHRLKRKLRKEKDILTANSTACRGIGMLHRVETRSGKLPESEMVRMVEVIVPDAEAFDLFEYIYETAGIGRSGGGAMWLGPIVSATRYTLPEDVPDEKTDS